MSNFNHGSILDDIKALLGISKDIDHFDMDIIIGINSAFMTLNQLGVGPHVTFAIANKDATWNNFLKNRVHLEAIKSYIYLKTRLFFDPPGNSFLVEAIKNQIEELEWRLNAQTAGVTYDETIAPTDPDDPTVPKDTETYVHTQMKASNEWLIAHDLFKYPSITVVDTGNNVVVGQATYLNESTVRLNFNSEFSGKAYLN